MYWFEFEFADLLAVEVLIEFSIEAEAMVVSRS